MNKYYVYIYLHPDGTPYYVGKGCDDRWCKKAGHPDNIPPLSRVWFPVKDVSEDWAFFMEMEYIDKYGRLDDGTGILENRTDGGDDPPRSTSESRKKSGASLSKFYHNNPEFLIEMGKKVSETKKKAAHITSEQTRKRHADGNFYSEEGKRKLLARLKSHNEDRSKKVMDTETGIVYSSIREAARETHTSRNTIKDCIHRGLDKWMKV
jgi:hypothetical protein